MLVDLLNAIRRIAPHKATAFVCWTMNLKWTMNAQVGFVKKVASQQGADVLDVSAILPTQPHWGVSAYYADPTHPNLLGHGLLAAVTARFVAQGLMRGGARA